MAMEAYMKYLQFERKYSKHTVKAYLRDLEAFASYCEREHGLGSPEKAPYSLIRNWIISLLDSGLGNRSINRKIAALKCYYRHLLRQERITANPLAGHRPLKMARKVEVPFSIEEMQRLLKHWPEEMDFEGLRDRLVVELLYSTGMRRAELIGLTLKDIDWEQQTVRVLGKRNKQRILPLLPSTSGLIQSYLEALKLEFPQRNSDRLLVTSSGNKMYESLVYRIINRYLGKVSVKAKKSPHILRHTFATHLLNQGADMNSVKELLGHSSMASTQVYTHNSIAELKRIHKQAHPRNKS